MQNKHCQLLMTVGLKGQKTLYHMIPASVCFPKYFRDPQFFSCVWWYKTVMCSVQCTPQIYHFSQRLKHFSWGWRINMLDLQTQLCCLSHCLRIHWSWRMMMKKKKETTLVSSSVSSSDASRAPFCVFYFSSSGFSLSFSSPSAPLRQQRSTSCCVSFSSSTCRHSTSSICGVK